MSVWFVQGFLTDFLPFYFDLRYDHHQNTFTETMASLEKGRWTTKLSSAGLIYAFYGKEAIAELVKSNESVLVDKIYEKVKQPLFILW